VAYDKINLGSEYVCINNTITAHSFGQISECVSPVITPMMPDIFF